MADETKVWFNPANGHYFNAGPNGMDLNGRPCQSPPDWARFVQPDFVYGELVEWSGGYCPVDPNQEVRCVFRDRLPYHGPAIWPSFSKDAAAAMWQHAPHGVRTDPRMDIIGYQVRVG